jgi:diguanylate cyclase (GGDEF)-like protein/PAS domain S-box-containing protein
MPGLSPYSADATLDSMGDAVISTDADGRVTYLNPAAEIITGWSRDAANGHPSGEVFQIIDRDTRAVARDPLRLAVKLNRTVGLTPNCLLIRRDGHEAAIEDSAAPIHNPEGQVIGAVIVFRDVGAAIEMSRQMARLAQHDALTGLPNRLLLADRLTEAIALAARHRKPLGVLFIDVDNFKGLNDTFGHAAGDHMLCAMANRLTATLRRSDTVCRYGGDEFVVVLTELEDAADAALVADKLRTTLAGPYATGMGFTTMTASIGESLYPDHGADAETLITHADEEMYAAKRRGSSPVAPDPVARWETEGGAPPTTPDAARA